ncbi:MAG TPA: RnfABCDGE type electron transport complex subunit B [Steroidobacteraceae bacterium]|nr:RnfABCDGE type electron transport complex subunit B [Steroidobacteraceae bacterium]
MTDEDTRALIDAIDALLPQTQCTRCGYAGCRPYATAIAHGEADINQCPPGGDATIHALASSLAREYRPLNPANGVETPPRVAVIDEERCIGCAKCLPACPVDAIVGAQRLMHTVLGAQCNGCELCLPPCPVDCIDLRPLTDARGDPLPLTPFALLQAQAVEHRRRYEAHLTRTASREADRQRTLADKKRLAGARHKGAAAS